MTLITEITIFVLAAFVGFEVISKVPTTLHTPLMSQTNAIHGIVMLGGLIVVGFADDALENVIGTIAIAFGTINIVGGFMVTDRMLGMFVRKPKPKAGGRQARTTRRTTDDSSSPRSTPQSALRHRPATSSPSRSSSSAIRQGTHPTTAKRGNLIAAGGMAIAVVTTLLLDGIGNWGLIAIGLVIGTAVGVVASLRVQMTEMPQMVALYNGVGGGAVGADRLVGVPPRPRARRGRSRSTPSIPILFSTVVGSVSFWGSNIAFGKLQGSDPEPADPVPGPADHQRRCCWSAILAACIVLGIDHDSTPRRASSSRVLIAAAVLGNLFVLPIGGADMPVVISLLNAFTGLSAAAAGFALDNVALIVAGTLVGSSGTILTMEMATAMNRSVANLLFAGFGAAASGRRGGAARSARSPRSAPRTRRSSSPTPTRS